MKGLPQIIMNICLATIFYSKRRIVSIRLLLRFHEEESIQNLGFETALPIPSFRMLPG